MGLLTPATVDTAFLKVGMYGGPGSGKSLTALIWATALGRTAVVDTEHSTDFYSTDFQFDRTYTRSIDVAYNVLEEAIKGKYDCFILDQITHLWEGVQDEVLAREQAKNSKFWKLYADTGNTGFPLWKFIKKPWKSFIHYMLNAPVHVFILGRMSNVFQMTPGGEPIKIGERMDAEKNTNYEPHIVIKMQQDPKDPKNVYALVEKDRSRTIQGQLVKNPTLDMLRPVLVKLGKVHVALPDDPKGPTLDETVDIALIGGMSIESQQRILILTMTRKGGIPDDVTNAKLKGVSKQVAAELINKMTLGDLTFFQ